MNRRFVEILRSDPKPDRGLRNLLSRLDELTTTVSSISQHERTLMDKIKQMARFKALYFCEGRSKPYSVNLSS